MRRVASKFVPRFLSVDQKQQRLDVCFNLKENAATGPPFFRMSLWVTKPGLTPKTRKPKLNPVNGKVRGHHHRRRQGKWGATSSQCWFVSLIRREFFTKNLFLLVKQLMLHSTSKFWNVYGRIAKRPDQWRNNTWFLHHDNAPAHAALLTWLFLTNNNMTVVPYPP